MAGPPQDRLAHRHVTIAPERETGHGRGNDAYLHGHTFGLVDGGGRKDTVIVRPMQALEVDLDADNPGQWAVHCHNICHAETGMMTTLSYRSGG